MYEIIAIRTVASDDQSHEHIELVGYESGHMTGEPIMIPIPRVLQRVALGDTFGVTADGQTAEVAAGKCRVCGHEPYLKTSADTAEREVLLELPRK